MERPPEVVQVPEVRRLLGLQELPFAEALPVLRNPSVGHRAGGRDTSEGDVHADGGRRHEGVPQRPRMPGHILVHGHPVQRRPGDNPSQEPRYRAPGAIPEAGSNSRMCSVDPMGRIMEFDPGSHPGLGAGAPAVDYPPDDAVRDVHG